MTKIQATLENEYGHCFRRPLQELVLLLRGCGHYMSCSGTFEKCQICEIIRYSKFFSDPHVRKEHTRKGHWLTYE